MFVCKICKEKYSSLEGLYSHLEEEHSAQIPPDMSTAHFYYYLKTGREHGNCVMCKQPTTFNEKTKKYNRFCNDPVCKMKYKEIVDKRMIGVYGKVNLLNDPNHQRKMLMNRSISGLYNFKGVDKPYVGSYELDFLKTMDLFFDWDPSDIVSPSPHTYYYVYEGEKHFYIPDFYIMSLGLEIEVKDGGDNPNMHHKIQDVDKEKEKLKDKVMHTQKINHYIKITNKNYYNLFEFFRISKEYVEKYGDYEKIPKIILDEDIKSKTINSSSKSKMSKEVNKAVNESYVSDVDVLKLNGYEPVEEGYVFSKDNLEFNIKKFGKENNILFITGLSGSGKSTIIKQYAEKYNAENLEFDAITSTLKAKYRNRLDKINRSKINPIILEYLDNEDPEGFPNFEDPRFNTECVKFLDWLENRVAGDDKLYILEGMQIFLCFNPERFIGKPMIIMGTSMVKSMYRSTKRYYNKHSDDIKDCFVFFIKTLKRSGKYAKNVRQLDELADVIGESYEPVEEGYVFSKDNLYINFEKFESGKSNICLITGLSGSGKSTLGKQLANKYHAEYVELDTFYNIGTVSYEDLNGTIYKEYADENKKDYEWLVSKKKSMNQIPNDLVIRMMQWVIRYCKKNKNKKYILEGVQIYSHGDAKVIKNEPLILINASMIKSIHQRHKREDSNNVNWKTQLKELPEIVRWYIDDEKQYNKFKKEIVEEGYSINEFKKIDISEESIKKYKSSCTGLSHIRTGKDYEGKIFIDPNNDVVGFYNLRKSDHYIQGIEINKKYQSKGLGKMLLQECINSGAERLSVNKNNIKAINMYKKDFKIVNEDKNMYYMELKNNNKIHVEESYEPVTEKFNVTESYVCFPLLNSIISSKYDDVKSKEQYKRDVNAFKQHFLKGISRVDDIDDAKAMKGDLQALTSYLNGIKYTNNYSEFKNIDAVKEIEAWICRVAIPELDLKINKYSRNLEPVNEYAHNITFAINNNLQRGIFGMMDNISSITIDDSIQLKRKNTVMQVITENLKYDDNTTIIKFGTNKDLSLNNDLNINIGSYLNWNKNNGINALLKNVSDELFNSKISIEDFHKIEGGGE